MRMKKSNVYKSLFKVGVLLLVVLGISGFAMASSLESKKIIIIKADDLKSVTPGWERFFDVSKEKGVKVSAGIICNSLKEKDFDRLNELRESGMVEFWNHGWDHKRRSKGSEFGGSGYEYQKKHFEDAQDAMKRALGIAPIAFGTPYNACDADTVKVMNENADMRLFFSYKAKAGLDISKILVRMRLRGEVKTGKPNFAKFKEEYENKNKNVTVSALQFHPKRFGDEYLSEYAKILDFLIAEGWTFMLPSEYVSLRDAK